MDACSFWQMRACIAGYNKANNAEEEVKPPSDTEFDDMVARLG